MKNILYNLIFGLFIFTGCSSENSFSSSYESCISSFELKEKIIEEMGKSSDIEVSFLESEYVVPGHSWIMRSYSPYFSRIVMSVSISEKDSYLVEKELVYLFSVIAQIIHKTSHEQHNQGVSIGEMWYYPDGSDNVNVISVGFTEKGFVYFEPQMVRTVYDDLEFVCVEVFLSKSEKRSCFKVRF